MAGGLQPTIRNTVPTALQKEDHISATSNALVHGKSVSNSVSSYDDEPTEEELRTLRRVADKLPKSAWLVAIIELCERFAYYGLSGPFQNYIQNPYHDPKLPGAIGLGQTGATGLGNFFQFWCYVTPILGAIIADQYLGKYRTILYFSLVYIVGLIILFLTSLPIAIEHGAALGGLIVAMIVIGLGTGGIKSNVSPLIAEQYQGTRPTIRVLKSGERVIVDPAVTIQKVRAHPSSPEVRTVRNCFGIDWVLRSTCTSISALMLAPSHLSPLPTWSSTLAFGRPISFHSLCSSLVSASSLLAGSSMSSDLRAVPSS